MISDVGKDLDFEGLDGVDDAIFKAVTAAYQSYMSPKRAIHVHDRANEAKEDYLREIPGELYRLMKDDIARVWGLLESPIEQVAIFQLAAVDYSNKEGWPIYAKVCRARGLHSHKHYPVQIIPQVEFGRFRVDFLFDLGPRGLFAIECDGEEYHTDKRKDEARDDILHREHKVTVLRLPGKKIWRDNRGALAYADIIKVFLK